MARHKKSLRRLAWHGHQGGGEAESKWLTLSSYDVGRRARAEGDWQMGWQWEQASGWAEWSWAGAAVSWASEAGRWSGQQGGKWGWARVEASRKRER